MALIFRTSSAANTVPSTIKNAPLTYEEGDGNFAYLLTNMSGSVITLDGGVDVTGSLEVRGPVTTFDGVGFWDPTTLQFNTITANNGNLILTGSLYGTASWALSASNAASASWAPVPNLQQVTSVGNQTTTGILVDDGSGVDILELYPGLIRANDTGTGEFVQVDKNTLIFDNGASTVTNLKQFTVGGPGIYNITLPRGNGNLALTVNGVSADQSGNVVIPTLNTGSLLLTASSAASVITFTKGDGSQFSIDINTGSIDLTPYLTTASFNAYTSSVVTTSSFNNFTASYNTGSFTGSFIGQLAGTASFAISASWAPSTATNTGSLLTTASATNNVITFTKGDSSTFNVTISTGSVDLAGYTTTSSFNAFTASYNTGSFTGSFSGAFIGTASWATSASWAPSTATNTGSLLTTASVSLNTITFTKGDGSPFSITVDTGSGGSGLSGGTQYYVPVWTGATTLGTSSLYESGSVLKTISGSTDVGLKLDFAYNVFTFGDTSGNFNTPTIDINQLSNQIDFGNAGGLAGLALRYGNNEYFFGSIDYGNKNTIEIKDANNIIKTTNNYNDIGLKLDFANNEYSLGDSGSIGNGNKLIIDNLGGQITLSGNNNNQGLYVAHALSGRKTTIGDYSDTNNSTKIVVNDSDQTVIVSGSTVLSGSLFVNNLTTGSTSNVLTYNSSTGQVFFTASSAIGGGTINTGSFLTTGSLSTTQQLSGSLNITGSLNFFSGSTNVAQIENGWVILSQVSASLNFANDAAAAAGGVPLGGLYRNGNAISIRVI